MQALFLIGADRMKRTGKFIVLTAIIISLTNRAILAETPKNNPKFDLYVLLELPLGSPIGQLRAVPVSLGKGKPRALLAVYCADAEVDPYVEMFFFPKDTLKLMLFTQEGEFLW